MKNLKKTILAASVALSTGIMADAASAHGALSYPPYVVFVGFHVEPAFAGEPNTMDFYAYWDKDGDASCDTDTDCVAIDTSQKGGKVEFLPGGYIKLLYCGPQEGGDHHAAAEHEHGACDHPLAEMVIADAEHPLDQAWDDPALYNSQWFKPTLPGVYGFEVHNLKLKKQGSHPSVVLKDELYVCTENHFSCIGELPEFPAAVVHPH